MAQRAVGRPITRRGVLGAAIRLAALTLGAVAGCASPAAPAPSPEPTRAAPSLLASTELAASTPPPAAPRLAEPPLAPTPTPTAAAPQAAGTLRLASNHAVVEVPWIKKVLDGFGERHPGVKVEHSNVVSRYLDQVPTWAAEGQLPDVLFVRPQHAAAWAYRKWLVSIDSLVVRDAQEIDPADFYPPQVEELKYQGQWLVLPQDYSVYGMYLRTEHFAEAKVDKPEDDWAWPDLLTAAKRLTRRESSQTTRWGVNWWPDHCAMPGVWYAEGGTFLTEDQRGVVLNTPENVQVTQWLADLSTVEGVAPKPGDPAAGPSPFASGRVSIEGNSSWAPALYRSVVGTKGGIDVVPLPLGAAGRRPNYSTGSGWALSRDARDRDLAWQLLKHLTTRDSIELLVSLPVRNLPGRISATPLWLDSLRAIGVPGQPETFPRMAMQSYPFRPVPWWLDYQDAYSELMPLIWTGQRRAAEVLPELERRVNEAAAKFR